MGPYGPGVQQDHALRGFARLPSFSSGRSCNCRRCCCCATRRFRRHWNLFAGCHHFQSLQRHHGSWGHLASRLDYFYCKGLGFRAYPPRHLLLNLSLPLSSWPLQLQYSTQGALVDVYAFPAHNNSVAQSVCHFKIKRSQGVVTGVLLRLAASICAIGDVKGAIVPSLSILTIMGALSGYTFSLLGAECERHKANSFEELWSRTVGDKSLWVISRCAPRLGLSAALTDPPMRTISSFGAFNARDVCTVRAPLCERNELPTTCCFLCPSCITVTTALACLGNNCHCTVTFQNMIRIIVDTGP